MISNDLKWNVHAEMICKKVGTRLCFLRQLKHTKVSTKDLLASTPLVYAQLYSMHVHFFILLILKKRQLDHLFRNVTWCTGHKTTSSSDGLFWRSSNVKSWILSAIHCTRLLKNTMGQRSICEELELNLSFLLRILLAHFQSGQLQRYHKQAGCYISRTSNSCCFSSNFDFYALVVCLERMGNFKWIEIVISLLALSLTFQLKANDCVWTLFVY